MINLHTEDYCEGCPVFEPDHRKARLCANGDVVLTQHDIYCEHRGLCTHIKKHLESKKKEGGE